MGKGWPMTIRQHCKNGIWNILKISFKQHNLNCNTNCIAYKSCDVSTGCFVFQCPSSTIWFFHPVTSISDICVGLSSSPCLSSSAASLSIITCPWILILATCGGLTCFDMLATQRGNVRKLRETDAAQCRHCLAHFVQLATYIANSTHDCPREDDRRWGWLPSGRMDCLYKVDKVLSILIFSP